MAPETADTGTPDQPTASAPASGDTASATTATPEQTAAQGQAVDSAEEPVSDDIRAQVPKYGELVAQLPPPVRKEFNRALTQSFQKAREQSKRYEPYRDFIDAYEADPRATVQAIAQRLGITPPPPGPDVQATDEVLTELATVIGDDEARRFAPIVEKLAKRVVESEVKPLKAQQEAERARLVHEQSQQYIKQFTEKHPDWPEQEQKILELQRQLLHPDDPLTHMDNLYRLANFDAEVQRRVTEEVKATIARMNNAAGASESVASGVNASRVSPAPRTFKDADEAYAAAAEAARKGQVWG